MDEIIDILKRNAWGLNGPYGVFQSDLQRYLDYQKAIGQAVKPDSVDLEDFVSFLDIEHFLSLKGSDTWSSEGNKTQLIIRNCLLRCFHGYMQAMTREQWKPYLKFAKKLKPGDYIITFNYDTLVEDSLDRIGKPYRFSHWPSKNPEEDVIILKLHGSMDWFDISRWQGLLQEGLSPNTFDTVFNKPAASPEKLFPDSDEEELRRLYRLRNIHDYAIRSMHFDTAPVMLSPSHLKIVYASLLKPLWDGLYGAGSFNSGLAIIGFALPEHDRYLQPIIYTIVDNYQNYHPGFKHLHKANMRVIDYKRTDAERKEIKEHYPFIDWERTDTWFDGFDSEAVEFLFARSKRTTK